VTALSSLEYRKFRSVFMLKFSHYGYPGECL
jgi:hypothetical protein